MPRPKPATVRLRVPPIQIVDRGAQDDSFSHEPTLKRYGAILEVKSFILGL
jgi:hypothetical protein